MVGDPNERAKRAINVSERSELLILSERSELSILSERSELFKINNSSAKIRFSDYYERIF